VRRRRKVNGHRLNGLPVVSFKKGRARLPRLSPPRVPGRHARRFWTAREDAIMRRWYPTGGMAACSLRLPAHHTSRCSIYARAYLLGLYRSPGGGQLPRWWVTKRATRLGLVMPHKKEPPWTRAETALMRKVPLHDLDKCAEIFRKHGFRRSPTAIKVRAVRLDISRRYRETLSAGAAAPIIGFDNKTVTTMCIAGEIKATRRKSRRLPQQGGAPWSITPKDLRAYVLANLERVDLRKVEKFAFVQLIAQEPLA
jgi:hypothetical protein